MSKLTYYKTFFLHGEVVSLVFWAKGDVISITLCLYVCMVTIFWILCQ